MYGEEAVSRAKIYNWYDTFEKIRWTAKLQEGPSVPICQKKKEILEHVCYIISQGSVNDIANNVRENCSKME